MPRKPPSKRPIRAPLSLSEWKARSGLTDKQIAALVCARGTQISRESVSAFLRGDRGVKNPNREMLLALQGLTGLSLDVLLTPTATAPEAA